MRVGALHEPKRHKNKRVDFPVQREGKKPADENRFPSLPHRPLFSLLPVIFPINGLRSRQSIFVLLLVGKYAGGKGQWAVDDEWTMSGR